MKKRILVFLFTIFMILSITACQNQSKEKDLENQTQEVTEQATEASTQGTTETTENLDDVDDYIASWPVTVTDHLDRTITLEEKPERIISGYYISTSALIALELEDNLVGIEAKADQRPIYSLAAPQLLELPNVGTAKEFDLEGCIALEPDLVILPTRLKDQISTLEEMGITVIGVNPENEELLVEMITMIAKLIGASDYDDLIEYYIEKTDELSKIHNDVTDKPTVYLAGNSSMLSTAAAKMYQNDLIEVSGGINVANDIDDSYWVDVSYEQLVAYNPDYIIIVPEADYTIDDVRNDGNLSELNAVKNNKIYAMPSTFEAWDSPVPSSILGKMWLTSILYEDKYTNEDFIEEAKDFYEEFYGFEIDEEALKN